MQKFSSAGLIMIVVVLALAAVALLLWYANANTSPAVVTGPTAAREAYWHNRIARVGAGAAYAEFAGAVSSLSPNEQHQNAHPFGGALFETTGLSGISTCDTRFNFGCYHEFLGRAITKLGLAAVPELNDACVKNIEKGPLSCQHGIGHGIMAAEGYDEVALDTSLAICKDLTGSDTIGGCYGGVFMEYNMQTMLGDQARVRSVHEGDPYYPCTRLDGSYLPACAFWSPQWWSVAGYTDSAAIGSLCDGFAEAVGRAGADVPVVRDCYQGLGVEAPSRAGFDPVNTAALCKLASKDPLNQLYCLSYAANSLTVGGGGVENGVAVCNGLTGDYLSYCTAYAKNEANQAVELPSIENA